MLSAASESGETACWRRSRSVLVRTEARRRLARKEQRPWAGDQHSVDAVGASLGEAQPFEGCEMSWLGAVER